MMKDREFEIQKWVLITGASSGLGRELAYLYASDRHNLLLIARSEDKLKEICNDIETSYDVKAEFLIKDLSEADAADSIFSYCKSKDYQISILINNAGVGHWGRLLEQDESSFRSMLNMMVLNTSFLTFLFGREMEENEGGRIIQIASTAAFQSGPYMATYFSSKAYLLTLSESMQFEGYQKTKIQIVAPGVFRSGFAENAKMEKSKFFNQLGVPDVKDLAPKIYNKIKKGRRMIIPGFQNKMIILLLRFFPRFVVLKVISNLLKKRIETNDNSIPR